MKFSISFHCTTLLILYTSIVKGIDWDSYDVRILQDNNVTETLINKTDIDEPVEDCEEGWMSVLNSCYYIEVEQRQSYEGAVSECRKKKARLLTLTSNYEYTAVMPWTAHFDFSWTGLTLDSSGAPVWSTPTTFDFKEMKWLSKPYTPDANGYSFDRQCAAQYQNHLVEAARYVYWHPCSANFYYICEKKRVIPKRKEWMRHTWNELV